MSALIFVLTTDNDKRITEDSTARRTLFRVGFEFKRRLGGEVRSLRIAPTAAASLMAQNIGLAPDCVEEPAFACAKLKELPEDGSRSDELRAALIKVPHRGLVIANDRLLQLLGYHGALPNRAYVVWATADGHFEVVKDVFTTSTSDLQELLLVTDAEQPSQAAAGRG